jgi:hypothetical protein
MRTKGSVLWPNVVLAGMKRAGGAHSDRARGKGARRDSLVAKGCAWAPRRQANALSGPRGGCGRSSPATTREMTQRTVSADDRRLKRPQPVRASMDVVLLRKHPRATGFPHCICARPTDRLALPRGWFRASHPPPSPRRGDPSVARKCSCTSTYVWRSLRKTRLREGQEGSAGDARETTLATLRSDSHGFPTDRRFSHSPRV